MSSVTERASMGKSVVVADAAQSGDVRHRNVKLQQLQHLAVAVLVDDVHALVRGDELMGFGRKRIGAQAQVISLYAVLRLQLIERLDQSVMRCAVSDDADFVAVVAHDFRLGNQRACGVELARQTVHVVGVVVRPLAVSGRLIMPAAAREPRCLGMIGARKSPVTDGIAVHVFVASETAQPFEVFRGQHLAAIQRLLRILEWLRHPVVHAQIEIGHHEHRRLQLLGEIEGVARHAETFGNTARQQHRMSRVSMRKPGHEVDVALRSSRRQSGRRANPLDVPDDAGNLHVIAQSRELRHQRNAWSGGGGHRTRSRPARAQNHADRSQLVFRLHDGEACFAIGADPVFLHVINQRLHQRRRRRNRVPCHDRHPGEHAAQSRCCIAVNDDHARSLIHALDGEWIGFGQRRRSVVVTGLGGIPVEIGGLDLLGKLLAQCLLDFGHVEVEQLRHHADVDHVLDQLAQLGFGTNRGAELVVGHGVERQVGAEVAQLQRLVIQAQQRPRPAT